MRVLAGALLCVSACLAAAPAAAATVTYSFTSDAALLGGSFVYVSQSGFIPQNDRVIVEPSGLESCTLTGAYAAPCRAVFFRGNGAGSDAVTLSGTNFASAAFGFDDGAFSRVGTYVATAGQATLTVALAAVPEPAAWAMMIGGFAAAGVAVRRRKLALA